MRPSQRPTATGMRVRSTRDANVLFHAVTCGILPMVSRRLDAADRAALRPGCVYIWEERSPASDATGAGMERFTEGRHWHPSRVRDDFLLYIEKDWDTNEVQFAERNRMLKHHRESRSSTSYPVQPPRRQPLVKQTYSAWVNTGAALKKWHMNAYYTEDSLDELRTVEDIAVLANLPVPHECYQRARSSTVGTSKKGERGAQSNGSNITIGAPRRNSTSTASQSSQSDREHQSQSQIQGCMQVSASAYPQPHPHPRYSPFPPSPISTTASSPSQSTSHSHSQTEAQNVQTLSSPSFVPHPSGSMLGTSQGPGPGLNAVVYRNSSQHPLLSPSPSPSVSVAPTSLPSPATYAQPAGSYVFTYPYANSGLNSGSGGNSGSGSATRSLVPLDHLRARASHAKVHREPADDEMLRAFRAL